jgi:hypothetical protein
MLIVHTVEKLYIYILKRKYKETNYRREMGKKREKKRMLRNYLYKSKRLEKASFLEADILCACREASFRKPDFQRCAGLALLKM